VSEVTSLHNEGFNYISATSKEQVLMHVGASLCICDAPARALVQEFTQYNGKFGCGFCMHEGKHIEKGNGFRGFIL